MPWALSFGAPQLVFARTELQREPHRAKPGGAALGMGIPGLEFLQLDCPVQSGGAALSNGGRTAPSLGGCGAVAQPRNATAHPP